MKKVIMGIIAFLPAALGAASFILNRTAMFYFEKKGIDHIFLEDNIPQAWENVLSAAAVLAFTAMIAYAAAVVIYFIYNLKNMYIYPDKKVGWGYMIVCIGIVAIPAYWYNFIRVRGR